jgi:Ca-activated chloride channel family protein
MRTFATSWKFGFAALGCVLLAITSVTAQTAAPSPLPAQQVRMSLIVTDRANQSVANVRQEDIQITEDGEQRIPIFFGRDVRPVHCVVAVDTSGSFQPLLRAGVNVTKALISNKRPDDEMMIIRFISSDKIETKQPFTSDGPALLDSLKLLTSEDGQSAVIDAAYLAINAAAAHQAGNPGIRRVVVMITDGEDRASFYTSEHLVKLLREKDVQLFVVGVTVRLNSERGFTRPSSREKAEKLMVELVKESGGRAFFPDSDAELTAATEQLILDLQSQYLIGFDRQPKAGEKGFKKIKVSIADPKSEKLSAITRSGFFFGPREPTKDAKSH